MEKLPLENETHGPTDAEARRKAREQAAAALIGQANLMATSSAEMGQLRRRQQIRRRWLLAIASLTVVGGFFLPGGVTRWRRERNVRIAEQALRQGEVARAAFALRVAAAAGADDVRFHRLAAELAARQKSAAGLVHRRRVASLDPTRANLTAWADDALAVGDLGEAREAVARLGALGHDPASRLRAGRLAAAAGQRAEALREARAAAADPSVREEAALDEGVLLIQSPEIGEKQDGERLLRAAAEAPATAERALQALLAAAARDRSVAAADPARQLLKRPEAPLAARLLAVRLLAETSPLEADAALRVVWETCRQVPADAVTVAQFLVDSGRAVGALAWLKEISPDERGREFPLSAVTATALSRLGRWQEAQDLLSATRWGVEEPFRLLALAQTARMITGQLPAKQVAAAIQAAKDQPEVLQRLFLQAEAWGMADAAMEIGREALRVPGIEKNVGERVFLLSVRSEDPAALPRFYEARLAARPNDERARINLALLDLLAGKNLRASAKIARDAVARGDEPITARLALALALGREGRAPEALSEWEKIPAEGRSPLGVGIRAMLLAWAGRAAEAAEARDALLAGRPVLPPALSALLRAMPPPSPVAAP